MPILRLPLASLIAGLACTAHTSCAQQALPPIRTLRRVVATSTAPLQAATTVRPLSNGDVIVNDVLAGRLILFDSTLAPARTILDRSGANGRAYGDRPGGLLAFRGDTSLFIDAASLSMLVVAPDGRVVRVAALPDAADAEDLAGGAAGLAAIDPESRLVYRSAHGPPPTAPSGGPQGEGWAALVRVDLTSRHADTLTLLRISRPTTTITRTLDAGYDIRTVINPLPTLDDWALLPSGAVAVVRGRDFHLEWISANGHHLVSPPIPFEWQRLTLDQRQRIVDSARAAMASVTRATPHPRGRGVIPLPRIEFTPATEIADYRPAFFAGLTRAAPGGRVWIRTTLDSPSGPVYDVVDSAGTVVARVRLPPGRVLLAVAPHDVVYLGMRDTEGSAHVEKALTENAGGGS